MMKNISWLLAVTIFFLVVFPVLLVLQSVWISRLFLQFFVLHTKSVEYLAVDVENAKLSSTFISALVDRSWRVMARLKELVKTLGGSHVSDFSSAILYFSGRLKEISFLEAIKRTFWV